MAPRKSLSSEQQMEQDVHSIRATQESFAKVIDIYEKRIKDLEQELIRGNYGQRLKEFQEWQDAFESIAPRPILIEVVDEMKKNRELRIKIYAFMGIGIFINLILNFLALIKYFK